MITSQLRWGMVGGGDDAFIGAVHRMAAGLTGRYLLTAGALSSTPEKSLASGVRLGLARERIYTSFTEMAQREAARPDGIEVVTVVTPNDLHAPAVAAFLKAGIDVICDKPFTTETADAEALGELATKAARLCVITYNYSFYPLIETARDIVRSGELGEIRLLQVQYAQEWLSNPIEMEGQKQALWRTDPARAGAGCIGDIGTHAFQLAEYVSGLEVTEALAELTSFVPGRRLDDNAHVFLRFGNGARGCLWASQVAPGHQNDLRLQIYGSKGSLEWHQESPEQLLVRKLGGTSRTIVRSGDEARARHPFGTRLPAGHPEGYLEAFANLYDRVADVMRGAETRDVFSENLRQGIRGVRFVQLLLQSHATGRWQSFHTH